MSIRFLISVTLCLLPLFGEGQTSNITHTNNGIGRYSFSLFGGVLPSNTIVSNVVWNFGDGVSVLGGTNLTAFHQYPYVSQAYNVEVSYDMTDATGNSNHVVEVETINLTTWDSPLDCPTPIFTPLKESDWCGTGELTLGWSFSNYLGWSADYVVWNLSLIHI